MKNFTQFLTEARETSASTEAKRLGLTGDGHGGWYDRNGEFVAKTVQGKLKFFGRDNTPGKKDSPYNLKAKPPEFDVQTTQTTQQVQQEPQTQQQPVEPEAQVPPEQQQELPPQPDRLPDSFLIKPYLHR